MSTLKNSNSSSNIPRLSRLPVRQSNTARSSRSSSAQSSHVNLNFLSVHGSGTSTARSRSSSARPSHANTNFLTVYGSGTMGRSSSYSNLSTPCQKIVPSTPSSGASSASKNFRMNDKEWQKAQFMRVKKIFSDYDPEMPPLKPLSIRAYVHSMNILFKQVDNRIDITIENYKESVSDYLKSFKYPYNIKPSVVKSPTVPSSWQHVLQIWIWLIDLIELFQNRERILLPQTMDQVGPKLFCIGANYMTDRFVAYNNANDENVVDNSLIDTLAQFYDINLADSKTSEDENHLDEKLISLAQAEESRKTEIQNITQRLDEICKSNATRIQHKYDRRNELLLKLKEIRIKKRNMELEYNKALSTKENLKTVIMAQPYTKAESKQIREKFEEICNVEQLKQQCIKEQNHAIDDFSLKINQQKHTINSIIHKTNSKIAVVGCKAPELQKLKMPDDLDGSNFEQDLQDFDAKMRKIDVDLKLKLENWKATHSKKEKEYQKITFENEEFNTKLEKLSKSEQKQLESQNKQKNALCEQLRASQLEIAKKNEQLEELIQNRPDVDGIRLKYEASMERVQNLKRLQQDSIKKADKLFVSLDIATRDIEHQQTDKIAAIYKAIEEL